MLGWDNRSYPFEQQRKKNRSIKMNRALGTDGTINLAFNSLESEGKERVRLKKVF